MQFLLDHWHHIAAVLGALGLLAWQFWPALRKIRLPSVGTSQPATTLKADLDLTLDLLSRAQKRAAPNTAEHFAKAVESLVKELTA